MAWVLAAISLYLRLATIFMLISRVLVVNRFHLKMAIEPCVEWTLRRCPPWVWYWPTDRSESQPSVPSSAIALRRALLIS